MSSRHRAPPPLPWYHTVTAMIVAGCLVAIVNFGVRSTFGFFTVPISEAHGWPREIFSFAMAMQNLVWGLATPVAGMLADRYGSARVLMAGAVIYCHRRADDGLHRHAGDVQPRRRPAGRRRHRLLVLLDRHGGPRPHRAAGPAQLGLRHRHRLGLARPVHLRAARRHAGLGLWLAAGAGRPRRPRRCSSSSSPPRCCRRTPRGRRPTADEADLTMRQAIGLAFGHRSYMLLVSGFFVCGFQLAFITVHMPPYLAEHGISQGIRGLRHGRSSACSTWSAPMSPASSAGVARSTCRWPSST